MLSFLSSLWKYRSEIALGIQLIHKLRQNAREFTQDYIRKTIQKKLILQMAVIAVEIGLFAVAYLYQRSVHTLNSRLLSSAVLWSITLYNVYDLLYVTLPELKTVHRILKSKIGYAAKYFLEISVTNELLKLNTLFLIFCLILGITSRTWLGVQFSYFEPWDEWFGSYKN